MYEPPESKLDLSWINGLSKLRWLDSSLKLKFGSIGGKGVLFSNMNGCVVGAHVVLGPSILSMSSFLIQGSPKFCAKSWTFPSKFAKEGGGRVDVKMAGS